MSVNPPSMPDDHPGRYGDQPPRGGPPPHGGQPPYGDEPYGQSYPPPGQQMPDPGLYPGNEYPPDRSARPLAHEAGAGSFFGALFDYSFTRYITPTIVKAVYVIVTVLVALGWLGGLVAAFQGGWLPGVLFLAFGWIVALVYLAIARISLEFFVAVISVSQKVNRYAERDGL
ncbi:DUF4282 domain-containing protein [Isoptericola sp. NEAU-Y5]|uniref:DUF4282 domain-containing protein n=1 Tax=Isoptericola luteus TaxID=2879484 RepID=A0ABS7ZMJ1_9MICO|nr:DUF4282 domain-containing protein [Isoptericola sp. NEAU-Y5]MCA5894879.1 DUF4282 domain-containing protein [Isoptericola sp. NEAU-Y5]